MAVHMPARVPSGKMHAHGTGGGMKGNIYAKTDKGREEIATRKYRLPAKLRGLLLMVDGQRSLETLANNVGLVDENVAFLLQDGYIALVATVTPPEPVAPSSPAVPAPLQAELSPVSMHDIYSSRVRY
jgi:hypothetical protein